jgi:hypothetical protein
VGVVKTIGLRNHGFSCERTSIVLDNNVEEPGWNQNSMLLQLLDASVSRVACVRNALRQHLIRTADIGRDFRIVLMVDTPCLDVHSCRLGCIADSSIDSSLLFVGPQRVKYHF